MIFALNRHTEARRGVWAHAFLLARAAHAHAAAPPPPHPPSEEQGWVIRQTAGPNSRDVHLKVGAAGVAVQRSSPPPYPRPAWSLAAAQRALRSQLAPTFLPSGYPSTVAGGYLRYVGWQAVHHAAGSANGVLASTFLLYSVGLGAGAIPTAGALSWVLKDGLGQAGTLLFGRAMAHNFDVASKSWYLAASAKLNLAMGLEIATFIFPAHFLPIAAAANAVKGLAWMAGGSSRSAFNVAFATDHNIADVTAKATSQTICTSLLGTSVGLGLAAAVGQGAGAAFACYAALAAVHLWSGYKSVQCVPLTTLNPSRLEILAQATIAQGGGSGSALQLPTPAELAGQDAVLRRAGLVVGSSLASVVAWQPHLSAALLPLYQSRMHILLPDPSSGAMHLVLHQAAGAADAATAALQAAAWRAAAAERGLSWACTSPEDARVHAEVAGAALRQADEVAGGMLRALSTAGWDTDRVVVEAKPRRAQW